MPKIKPYINKIPVFYRKQAIDIMLFAHVTALNKFSMPINESILDFLETYNISIDDYPLECAQVTFTRMRNAFLWSDIKDKKV